jgi:hypothetical protein
VESFQPDKKKYGNSMTTFVLTHHACLDHDPGPHHPECPDRLKVILAALEAEEFHFLHREEAPHATRLQLERVHPPSHIDHILAMVPRDGFHSIDGDTTLSPDSGEAALRAAGARPGTPSAPSARRDTMPSCIKPWAFASSTTWWSARCTPARPMG